ncbi:MAG: NAD-dependent epimerase/dehydratase family protein [Chlorobiota bacterium]|nr:NAD-dependent epimerase/dehydratase family protein [Chlorobiota bacterium]QQS67260.1 MAG: NAD-dependent epimerase/dehydratase family protein [Chlorobiota bacterium]
MSKESIVLITGAGGEIGHSLVESFYQEGARNIVAMDLKPLPVNLTHKCLSTIEGNILDKELLNKIAVDFNIGSVIHLAALLSTSGERNPLLAHEVNVQGTLNLLELANSESNEHSERVKFIFPSSIAVYGIPSLEIKMLKGKVNENEFLNPITMYGANKLASEHLGRYYSKHYKLLENNPNLRKIDFRALRFPGLISAFTIPSGGTSDYAPEMLHSIAKGETYKCFARADTTIPFMVMPDAINAILKLHSAKSENLTLSAYNVTSFAPSAIEIFELIKLYFNDCKIEFDTHLQRQQILDSWCADIDDSAAKIDWGWNAEYDLTKAFEEYLIPQIRKLYS